MKDEPSLPKFALVQASAKAGDLLYVRVGGRIFRTRIKSIEKDPTSSPGLQKAQLEEYTTPGTSGTRSTRAKGEEVTYDPRESIDTGRGCLLAAERCLILWPTSPDTVKHFPIPAVFLLALSVEIYLKAVINMETGENAKGHDLLELFERVYAESRDAIRVHQQVTVGDLKQRLGDASNAFEHWRYIYEKGPSDADINFLEAMARACQSVAETLLRTKK
jgi:HEPN domain-containing protein